jgi:hypothetical protein
VQERAKSGGAIAKDLGQLPGRPRDVDQRHQGFEVVAWETVSRDEQSPTGRVTFQCLVPSIRAMLQRGRPE